MKVRSLSHVQLFATPWTAAYQAPLSMGFSRQEYWSGLPLPSPLTQGQKLIYLCIFKPVLAHKPAPNKCSMNHKKHIRVGNDLGNQLVPQSHFNQDGLPYNYTASYKEKQKLSLLIPNLSILST